MKDGVESEDATTANLAIVYHSCTLDKFKEEISLPLPARRGCGNWLAGCGAVMLRGTARRPRRHLIIFVNRKLKLNSLTRCEIGPLAEAGAGLGREEAAQTISSQLLVQEEGCMERYFPPLKTNCSRCER